jgi:hypothetical protein
MRTRTVLLAALMLTAGCVGTAPDDTQTEQASTPTENPDNSTTREETRSLEYQQNVGVTVTDSEAQLGTLGTPRLAPAVGAMGLELSWEEPVNRFGLEVELADGSSTRVGAPDDPSATSLEAEVSVDDQPAGTYKFTLVAPDGATVPDKVTLEGTVTVRVTDASADEASTNDVQTERTDDGWRATKTYEDTGTTGSSADLEVDTVNGEIALDGTADEQDRAAVAAYAKADTEEEAIDRVRDIQVTVRADQGDVTATAKTPDDDWENRGANVDASVTDATTVSGGADTTNGPITINDLTGDDLTLDTTNGPITGDVTTSGSVDADTTNGAIELALEPTSSADLTMDTTNGRIDLGLTENADIAYEIDASTTNGQITEDMQEAQLEREGRGDATLVTQDGNDRPIQVTGTMDTTNGGISFQGR